MAGCFRRPRSLFAAALLSSSAVAQDPDFYDLETLPQIHITFSRDSWLQELVDLKNNGNPDYVDAIMTVDGVTLPNPVGVQHKGDASYQGDIRENFKITTDAYDPDQEFRGYDILSLDSALQSSVFNEVSALWVLKDFAHVPLANLAHVILHDPTRSYDVGVYTNTERVDGGFARTRFGEAGHRYHEHRYPLDYLGPQASDYVGHYQAQGGDPNTLFFDIAAASIALENTVPATMKADLDPFLDTDAVIRILVGYRMMAGWDGLGDGNNYFLYEDVRNGGRLVPVPWDLDLSWRRQRPIIPTETDRPVTSIFTSNELLERARFYALATQQRGLKGNRVKNKLADLKALAKDAILGSQYDDLRTEAQIDAVIDRIIQELRSVRRRVENDPIFQRELPIIDTLVLDPSQPTGGTDVWLSARVVWTTTVPDRVLLWSRVGSHDGHGGAFLPIDMLDDGLSHDGAAGDGVYGGLLPAADAGTRIQYYVEARPLDDLAAGYGFEPLETEYRPHSLRVGLDFLRLNELVADNDNGDQDEAGEEDDWLELVNTGPQDYDLSGHYLSDEFEDPGKWEFPAGTTVPAGGFLRVWCDDEAAQGPLHASFRLSKAGEQVQLSAAVAREDLEVLEKRVFGPLKEDQAFGRVPDHTGKWFYVDEPTGVAPVATAGAWNLYDGRPDGALSGLKVDLSGQAKVGQTLRFDLQGGAANSTAVLYFSAASDRLDLGKLGVLAIQLVPPAPVLVPLDGSGAGTFSVVVPGFAGFSLFCQALQTDFSNAAVFVIEL